MIPQTNPAPRLTMYRVEAFAGLGDDTPLVDLIPAFSVSQARALAESWHPFAACLQITTVSEPHVCPLMMELFPDSWRLHAQIIRLQGLLRTTFISRHTGTVPASYAYVPTIDWRYGQPIITNCDPERLPS